MKFTEEQYKKLVNIKEERFRLNLLALSSNSASISEEISELDFELYRIIVEEDMRNEALALMNPLTRNWAHEQFVEKEKRYIWTSKRPVFNGDYKRLFRAAYGYVSDFYVEIKKERGGQDADLSEQLLTETEVREYGYNPEWFDKEEV